MTDYLFVYGTLMHGYKHEMADFLNQHAEFYGEAYFNGKLYKVANFPGAVLSNLPEDKVYGHVFKLKNTDPLLSVLDAYEGIDAASKEPDLYKRLKVRVYFENANALDVWVYVYNLSTDNLALIPSGRFIK